MGSSVVSSPLETCHFLKTAILEVISDTITTVLNRSALASQGRQTADGRGGGRADMDGRGGYTGGRLGGRVGTRGGRGGPRGDGFVVYCYCCKDPAIQSISAPFEREISKSCTRLCHYSR